MSEKLDMAIEAFQDEKSVKTLAERISGLRQALMWNALMGLQQANKDGKGLSADLEHKHKMCLKYLNEIEKLYAQEVKMNKMAGIKEDEIKFDFLTRVKNKESSIGGVVREISPIKGKQNAK